MNSLMTKLMPLHAALATAALASPPRRRRHQPSTIDALHLAKYIIVERDGEQHAILFPRKLQHSEMLGPEAGRPISAGFYQIIDPDHLLVDGGSTTLNLNSRPEDAAIIRTLLQTTTL